MVYERSEIFRALNESVEALFTTYAQMALIQPKSVTSNSYHIRFHLIMASYLAIIPEAEDMLSVKRGVFTNKPIHRFLVSKGEKALISASSPRKLESTLRMLNMLQYGVDGSREELKNIQCFRCHQFSHVSPFLDTIYAATFVQSFAMNHCTSCSLEYTKWLTNVMRIY